ncbi:MAG: hypothetical protein PHD95_04490 [Candidatus ainarchaeum sp.]|nr:hypothetical protein [Candidatus ainarchaeum sp.]
MAHESIGAYSFLIGVIIAVIAGIAGSAIAVYAGAIGLILVILGLIVGFLNITDKETMPFLVAAVALMVAGSANLMIINTVIPMLGTVLQAILANIVVFIAPAAIIVGLKAIIAMAKNK